MTVASIEDVATELGVATPTDPATVSQWNSWLLIAEMLIELRLGPVTALDARVVGVVETLAVAEKVKHPDSVSNSSKTVSVDDASVQTSAQYSRSAGQVTILDQWWEWLTPADGFGGAFSIGPEPVLRAPGAEWPWC